MIFNILQLKYEFVETKKGKRDSNYSENGIIDTKFEK